MSDASYHALRSPYRPLPSEHFRILVLQPGRPDAPLEAQPIVRTLDVAAREHEHGSNGGARDGFEAISYCWGAAMSPHSLHMTDGTNLTITMSLYSALHAFRLADRPRSVWADAVCINQHDISERSAQVGMMSAIYSTARRVLIWLGPSLSGGSETTAFVTLTAPIVPKGHRPRRELLQIIQSHLTSTAQCKCCSISSPHAITLEEGLAAVAKLLERPWFGRLWVVQEVALAKEILLHCGSHFVPWEIFTEVARVPGQLEGDQQKEQILPDTMSRATLRTIWAHCNYLNQLRARNRQLLNEKEAFKPTALCKDLLMLSRLGCQDPHDRIYGVSRVLGLHGFDKLQVDYSTPVSELYRRVVELSLTAPANRPGGRAVLMLALAGTEDAEAQRLKRPSWVPHLQHLSERSRSKHTYYQWAFAERQFYADAALFRCKILEEDPQQLLVRGKRFGKVHAVLDHSACPSKHIHRRTPSKCPDQEAARLIAWYHRCCDFIETELLIPHSEQSSQVDDSAKGQDTFGAAYHLMKSSERIVLPTDLVDRWLTQASIKLDEIALNALARNLSPYVTGYPFDREWNLCVMETDYGFRAAWIPPSAKPGDESCYFAGAPYPFIVRRRDDSSHKLIGDSLILGLGESDMLEVDPQEWSVALDEARQADSKLKSWIDSQRRAELKIQDFTRVRAEDQVRKNEVLEAISKLRSLYLEADEYHQWIALR